MSLTITPPDYTSAVWNEIPLSHRQEIRSILRALAEAPAKGITAWMKQVAPSLGLSHQSLRRKYDALILNHGSWIAIVDQRKAPIDQTSDALIRNLEFAVYLTTLVEQNQRKCEPAFRRIRSQWKSRKVPIPGLEDWPGWPTMPKGFCSRNLRRIIARHTNTAKLRSIRVGTSSKTNPFLATTLTSRTQLWPQALLQMDDVWHDNFVIASRPGSKPQIARVIELGMMDVFSANRFHWGAKPRLRGVNGSYEQLRKDDARLFVAGGFMQHGYSPNGTLIMAEHNTASISEEVERILYDATGGRVRVTRQPMEHTSAINAFWPGSEGGNFHAKGLLESYHNPIHNDLGHLPMQTGSNSSGLSAPVNTARIEAYLNRLFTDVLKKCPHLLSQLKLPTWDFHTQFLPFLTNYYNFGLATRTDHNLEGWAELGHIITEYTLSPGSEQFISEKEFLKLPAESQHVLTIAARNDPSTWLRRRNLSSREVWDRKPTSLSLPISAIVEIIGPSLARECKVNGRFIEFDDLEISFDPLIFDTTFISGPAKGTRLHHGDTCQLYVDPFRGKTAIVIDAKGRFIGELPLYKRVCPINAAAFQAAATWEDRPDTGSEELYRDAGRKKQAIAEELQPLRIRHAETAHDYHDMKAHNNRLISGAPITPEEIAAARSISAHQGQRTAAANRLQRHGDATDWDHIATPAPATSDPFADLPDDTTLPDAF